MVSSANEAYQQYRQPLTCCDIILVLFLRPFAPPPNEVVLFSSGGACLLPQWSTGTDQSIGGHSSATLSQSEDGLRFRGVISMALDRGVSGAVFTGYAAMRSLVSRTTVHTESVISTQPLISIDNSPATVHIYLTRAPWTARSTAS